MFGVLPPGSYEEPDRYGSVPTRTASTMIDA